MNWESIIAIGAVVGGLALVGASSQGVWDPISETRLRRLHPRVEAAARRLLRKARYRGIKLRITSGYRTYAEQDALYAQGRSLPGRVVTNARGGRSYHNFGLAFDVVEIRDGVAIWDNPRWEKIGQIGKSVGLEWGGDFVSFTDLPHFQNTMGKSPSYWDAIYRQGQVEWIE